VQLDRKKERQKMFIKIVSLDPKSVPGPDGSIPDSQRIVCEDIIECMDYSIYEEDGGWWLTWNKYHSFESNTILLDTKTKDTKIYILNDSGRTVDTRNFRTEA
jgi:hypothetical protein